MSRAAKSKPSVQFVSKPILEPFRDGSKCLVRDLCLHLSAVSPHVLGTNVPCDALFDRAVSHAVYGGGGGFSPALADNAKVALFLLLKSRADLWHFVFAPNPRTSQVGRLLRRVRKVPTVQTIASPPLSFERPSRLIFADCAVAQSEWTRAQFEAAFRTEGQEAPPISVIPPPAPHVAAPDLSRLLAARAQFGIDRDAPLFLYPGDLEVSRGAQAVISFAQGVKARLPYAHIVLAYRDKTSEAKVRAAELAQGVDPSFVHFACNVPDIHALVATSSALLFPVDDLYGKVDLPIVLLEALRLGTPVLALDQGPLASLRGAKLLGEEPHLWLDEIALLGTSEEARRERKEEGRRAVEEHYSPEKIARMYETVYEETWRMRR